MNNLFFSTITLFFFIGLGAKSSAQVVIIPDANFKATLLANTSINTNSDTAIQISEAQAFSGTMDVSNKGITDLTGIETFIALDKLTCTMNSIDSLDLSMNIALTEVRCFMNPLVFLNVSANTALTYLDCHYNQLTNLDLSSNANLLYFNCFGNQLTSLNLSSNPSLSTIICSNNQLTTLDLSKNSLLFRLHFGGPQLINVNLKNGNNTNIISSEFNAYSSNFTCIQVDDTSYAATNWIITGWTGSYSTNCYPIITDISEVFVEQINVDVFPNPTQRTLGLRLEKMYTDVNVDIFNLMGKVVYHQNYDTMQEINLELEGPKGIYFIKVQTEEGETTIKVLKE
ncbi:MAG: T9SS type A sorting domain-containing protein [Aureispira sp.]|nr:T9SS type A sorting domain-containing protein [Aureispira sp.]